MHDEHVTGTARGATRSITGTPYYRDAAPRAAVAADPVVTIDQRFSVRSPQRMAQLRADRSAVDAPTAAGHITGSFAFSQDKITGNAEFLFRPRQVADAPAAHTRISGEGRSEGLRITGDSWADQRNVTGIDGYISAARNPSQRAGKPERFAGSAHFKTMGPPRDEQAKQLVTGMFGWSSNAAARVTLSGGAHG